MPHSDFGSVASVPVSSAVRTQSLGTCYAHAIATVVRATESRIVSRPVLPHHEIVQNIVSKHGYEGGDVEKVLAEECPTRNIRFKKIQSLSNESHLQTCIKTVEIGKRPVLMYFALSEEQWEGFSAFFRNNPTGILHKADINKFVTDDLDRISGLTGHAVVVVKFGKDDQDCWYMRIKNSWGDKFGESGYFKVGLDVTGVARVEFYDVFFFEDELSDEDRRRRFALWQCRQESLRGRNSNTVTNTPRHKSIRINVKGCPISEPYTPSREPSFKSP